MKAILVGDLHVDNRKSLVKNSDSFDEIFRLFNLITYTVLEEKPDFVIFLGDIFDSPDYISTNVISIMTMLFNDLSKLTRVIILAGNHDVVDDTTRSIDLTEGKKGYLRASLIYPFKISEDIFVVDEPIITHFDDIKTSFVFIPYSLDIVQSIESIVSDIKNSYKNILIGHFETKDINYVSLIKDTNILERLPSAEELFTKYNQNLVLLGHIHDICSIKKDNGFLQYLGAARNINFNNKDTEKGIWVLDIDNLNLKFVPNDATAIYKIFRTSNDLEDYIENNNDEILAKTKIRYIYSNPDETVQYHYLKKRLRKLEFEKNIFSDSSESINDNKLKLEELKNDNALDKDNLFKFILDFKNIDTDEHQEYLKFINSFVKEESNDD